MGQPLSRTGLLLASVLAVALPGCIEGGSPRNLAVNVANLQPEQAAMTWPSQGIYGTGLFRSTETEPVGGCAIYFHGFGPGNQQLTISLDSQSLTLSLEVGAQEQRRIWVVIGVDKSIRQVTENEFPQQDPCSLQPS